MKLNEISRFEKTPKPQFEWPLEEGHPWPASKKFESREEIEAWMNKYVGTNFTISADKQVDVTELNLSYYAGCNHPMLTMLPVKFDESLGDFHLGGNSLTTMENCPDIIRGDFSINVNKIKSFEHSPKIVRGDYNISNNFITSLIGIAEHIEEITGTLTLDLNRINDGGLGLLQIAGLQGIDGSGVSWQYAQIINKYLKVPKHQRDIFGCQQELIDAGLEEYAQL